MRATVAFDRKNGDKVQAGDVISVSPLEAAALRYQKKASFISSADAQAASSKRLLQRRDMEAENNNGRHSAPSSKPSDQPDSTPEGSGRSRRIRRRDLEAGG